MQGLAVTPEELRQQWNDLANGYKILQLQYRLRDTSTLYDLEALKANLTTIFDLGHQSIFLELQTDFTNTATISNYYFKLFFKFVTYFLQFLGSKILKCIDSIIRELFDFEAKQMNNLDELLSTLHNYTTQIYEVYDNASGELINIHSDVKKCNETACSDELSKNLTHLNNEVTVDYYTIYQKIAEEVNKELYEEVYATELQIRKAKISECL